MFRFLNIFTKMSASHEVITGLFWVFAMNFSSVGVKLGKLMSM